MINRVKYISKVFTRPRLNASLMREGEEIFHSLNPFVGDKLVFNGVKLANGPRSFFRQLTKLGMPDYQCAELVAKIEAHPDLYTVFSRELSQISPEAMKGASYTVFEDIRKMAHNFIEKPELTESLRGYGSLVSSGLGVRTSALIEKGIYDFKTAELLASSMKKRVPEYNLNYYIPDLMQISETIPSNGLVKVYDNCLKLVDLRSAEEMTRYLGRCKFPKNEKELQALVDSLEQLSLRFSQRANYNAQEMDILISTLREPYQVSFASELKNMNENLATGLINVKSEGEAKCVVDLLQGGKSGKYDLRSYSLQELLKNGCLENGYQQEIVKLISSSSSKLKSFNSESIARFSELAKKDLLNKIKTETDYNIAKLMIDRMLPEGKPVYHTEAIIRVLEQKPEQKAKILEILKKPFKVNEELYAKNYMQRNSNFIQKNQFQREVPVLSSNLSPKKLLESISVGEVVQVGDKLFVNAGNELAELKMSKEVFEELFMSEKYISQGWLGDCGFVASIDAIMSTPKGRTSVYKLFEQVPDSKDIIISLENTPYKVKFPNGEFNASARFLGMHPGTPKGLRMLEQACGAVRYTKEPYKNNIITMYSDFCPHETEVMHDTMSSISADTIPSMLLKKGSYKIEYLEHNLDKAKEAVKDVDSEKNTFLILGTSSNPGVNVFDNFCINHYHNVKKVEPDLSFHVTNPHMTQPYSRVPFYEVSSYSVLQRYFKVEII